MGEPVDRLCEDGTARAGLRVLVVAAHPDDETIGAGDRLARLRDACTVVHVTDGAPEDRRFFARAAEGLSRSAYARLRREEARSALGLAGIAPSRLVSLGVRDLEASFEMAGLAERLAALCAALDPDVLLTHAYEGGHPDHDATAFAVHAAALLAPPRSSGPDGARGRWPIVEMTGYHDREGHTIRGEFLPAAPPGDRAHERVISLDEEGRRRKHAMLAAFASQADVLGPFPVDVERFRSSPRYRFADPPHAGPLHYERQGFTLSGASWRGLARGAARNLGLGEGPI